MRRKDREIVSRAEIDAIIRGSLVCRIATAHGNQPYIVPVSFGYDGSALYIHTAAQGRKIDAFAANARVCFEFERNVELRRSAEKACEWSFSYESVIGFGDIAELTNPGEKERGLNAIMRQYSGKDWPIDERATQNVRVWKINITELTGKKSQPKVVEPVS